MSSIRRYALAALASAVFAGSAVAKDYELLNVSYDPTRELYRDHNADFPSPWKQSHPGDYGEVKRFVVLSALQPGTTLGNLGFRCARSQP